MRKLLGCLFLHLLLTSCGGGGGGVNSIQNISQPLVSVFVNSPAKGVRFNTSSGLSGVTNENGEFHYRVGDSVEFSLELGGDKIVIGSKTFSSAQSETSVLSLSGNGIDPLAVSQVLQTLDVGTVVGKMDFTGITLSAGLRSIIQEALVSSAAASSRVAKIAGGLLSNGYSPKNGANGVNTAEAISRLSTQEVNQQYLRELVTKISEDSTPLSVIFDKTFFIIANHTTPEKTYTESGFHYAGSNGIFYEQHPNNSVSGTYTVSEDGKTGTFILSNRNANVGSYRIKVGNDSKYFLDVHIDAVLDGFITGTLVSDFDVSDLFGKTLSLKDGCHPGVGATYSISNDGAWVNTCGDRGKFKRINGVDSADWPQFCNTTKGGFRRPIPNVVCIENHTKDTNGLIALAKGSLKFGNGSGVIVKVYSEDDEPSRSAFWNFTY
jgi:hypothetical protein